MLAADVPLEALGPDLLFAEGAAENFAELSFGQKNADSGDGTLFVDRTIGRRGSIRHVLTTLAQVIAGRSSARAFLRSTRRTTSPTGGFFKSGSTL